MAYADFPKTMKTLDQEDEKQSIFQEPGVSGAQQQSGTQPGALQTGGESSYIGQTSSQGTAQQGAQTQTPKQEAAKIMSASKDIQAPTGVLDLAKKSLSDTEKKAQDEANAYVGQYSTGDYGYNAAQIPSAIKGGGQSEDFSKLMTRLTTGPEALKEFAPTAASFAPTVEKLKTDKGIGQLIRATQGPQYTSGQASMDAMLLSNNPQFRQQANDLIQEQARVSDAIRKTQSEAPTKAAATQKAGYEGATGKIKSDIENYQQNLIKQQADEAAQYNAARQYGDPNASANQALEDLYARGFAVPSVGRDELRSGYGDLSKWVSNPGEATPEQMVDQNEQAQFQNILTLLGKGGQPAMTRNDKGPSKWGFDTSGFQNYLQEYARNLSQDRLAKAAAAAAEAEKSRPMPGSSPNLVVPELAGNDTPMPASLNMPGVAPVPGQYPTFDQLSPDEIARMSTFSFPY